MSEDMLNAIIMIANSLQNIEITLLKIQEALEQRANEDRGDNR